MKINYSLNEAIIALLIFFSGVFFSISTYISYLKNDYSYLFFPLILSSISMLFMIVLVGRVKVIRINKMNAILFLIFASSCLFSTVFSHYDYINLRDAFIFYYLYLTAILINIIIYKYQFLLKLYIYGLLTPLLITILFALIESTSPPISGHYVNPNSLGLISSFSLLCAVLALCKKHASKRYLIVFYIFIALSLIVSTLSLSRTAIYSSILVMLLFFLIRIKLNLVKWIFISICILVTLFILDDLVSSSINGVMNKTINNSNIVSGRDIIAKYYWEQVNAYGAIFFDNRYPVDNTYIKLSIKYGYIPTILFLIFIFRASLSALKSPPLLLSLTLFFLISIMETIYYSVPFILLITFAFRRESKKNDT